MDILFLQGFDQQGGGSAGFDNPNFPFWREVFAARVVVDHPNARIRNQPAHRNQGLGIDQGNCGDRIAV